MNSTYILLFVIGLVIGSFINVVTFRYNPEGNLFNFKNWGGRSKCPKCHKTLAWYELIPVISFFIQKRKCRGCSETISWQYLIVELASGFAFLVPFYLRQSFAPASYMWAVGGIWVFVLLGFIMVWAIDYRLFIIPNELNYYLAFWGVVLTAVKYYFSNIGLFSDSFAGGYYLLFQLSDSIIVNHILGAVIGVGLIGLIVILTKGRGIGIGDLKLVGALGLVFGWPDIILIVAFAFIIGAIFSIYLLAAGKKGIKEAVPFGPFLVLGSLVLMFFGETLLRNYFTFFSLF